MESAFWVYLKMGFNHIADPNAYDHILFVIALCAIYRISEWKRVAILVTAFTIGHSVTLALAALEPQNLSKFGQKQGKTALFKRRKGPRGSNRRSAKIQVPAPSGNRGFPNWPSHRPADGPRSWNAGSGAWRRQPVGRWRKGSGSVSRRQGR